MTFKINKLFLLMPILFTLEMVFGYTGTLIMFGRISIRVVIFLMAFLSLYGYSLHYVIKNKVKIFRVKDKESVIGSFNMVDISFLILFISTILSMIVVPRIRGNISLSLDEIRDSAAMMSLFFPLSFLIKKKEIDFSCFEKYIKILIFGLGIVHIALYIGQSHNSTFLVEYFNMIKTFLGGSAVLPPIILGHGGYVRIIYSTSIFLIIGLYLFFKDLGEAKWYDYICFYAETAAICTTMTKSIWLGIAAGLLIYALGYSYVKIRSGEKRKILKLGMTLVSSFLMIIFLDFTIFSGMIGVRLGNTFINSSFKSASHSENEELKEADAEGTVISNDIKIEQSKVLLNKWRESPIIGHGYGSYVEGYIRSEASPFSYEMTLFAMLMKIGILGMLCWVSFGISMVFYMYKTNKESMEKFYAWMFLLVSFVIVVQTNPFLLNFSGMGFLLVISLSCINSGISKETQKIYRKAD